MALVDNKITLAEYADKLISTLPVKPKITAAELQAFFNKPSVDVIIPAINGLIDAIQASTGGAEIGATVSGMAGTNVTALLTELYALKASLDSPEFTGTPTAPTPASGDDSAKIATTGFVNAAISEAVFDSGAADMAKVTYDPTNKATDIFAYATGKRYAAILDKDDWTLDGAVYKQTLTVTGLVADGSFDYFCRATANKTEYAECGVEPQDISTANTIVFTAVTEPTSDITISLLGVRARDEE
jgi:hypothetical protein